ncbi:Small subunit (SSU) processome component [Sporothrix epigloea]|uniref:Small subunit (SSU) processome component n=1 Tax=Sporothrix epigloea TaxID=1892477 RepID=A0ABP0D3A8_9PEZI
MSSTKRKAPPVHIARPQTTQNAKHISKAQINESRTSVISVPKHQQAAKKEALGEAIEISSDEDESDNDAMDDGGDLMDEDEPAAADAGAVAVASSKILLTNGHAQGPMNDDDDNDDDAGDHEPTFGDLVREHETIDVTAALSLLSPADNAANGHSNLPATAGKALTATANATAAAAAAAPTLASLGHLLNAALRSGDDANLEICFNTTTDATWVRNTIQRLDPSLAGTLLQKLAARIHRRPGRAHTLVGWVQWTLITHGGALLANQTGVTRALQELHRVLEERARGLNSLLLLKGKLDMLEAQMQMRRLQRAGVATVGARGGSSKAVDSANNLGRAAGGARGGAGRPRRGSAAASGASATDYDEDNVVTYNEELEDEDEDEGDESGQILVSSANVAGESFVANSDEEALDEEDEEDSSEDDDNDNGAEDDDDDELEEMDDDETGDEDEVDFDDVDDEEDDDEDDDDEQAAPPPPKLQKKAGAPFSKRR